MKNLKLKLLVGLLGLSSLGLVHAETATTTMEVSTTVTATCTVTATNMTFTAFSQAVGEVTSTATVTPTCTKGTAYSIVFNGGANGDGTTRKMVNGSDATELLTYELFQDNMFVPLTIDDDTIYAGLVGDGFGGADQTITIGGKVDTNQQVKSGSYSDTITVSINY